MADQVVVERRLKSMVVFAILMENRGGVIDKSPDYIWEKAEASISMGDTAFQLLDQQNLVKYWAWCERWMKGGSGVRPTQI